MTRERESILAFCAQIPELEARRLASESIPVGTESGERLPDKDTPIVHMVPPMEDASIPQIWGIGR